jgi:high-affinity K+ transport system ATPase subunit B
MASPKKREELRKKSVAAKQELDKAITRNSAAIAKYELLPEEADAYNTSRNVLKYATLSNANNDTAALPEKNSTDIESQVRSLNQQAFSPALGNKKTGNVLADAMTATRALSAADVSESNIINILSEYFSGINSINSAHITSYAQMVIQEVGNEQQSTLAQTESQKVGGERQM